MYRITLLAFALLVPSIEARDATHYPRDSAGQSAEYLGTFKGSYKDFFVLSVQTRVDPTFNEGQKSILRDAMDILLKRALKTETIDCAYRAATKDLPKSRDIFETQLAVALSPFASGGATFPSFAFIARYWSDPNSVGLGYLNLFFDTSYPTPGLGIRHHLHIAINSDFLGFDSGYLLAKDTEYWAGVIAHEFLHNLSYDHPNGYKGSFIEEYGTCLQTNGLRAEAPAGAVPDRVIVKDY